MNPQIKCTMQALRHDGFAVDLKVHFGAAHMEKLSPLEIQGLQHRIVRALITAVQTENDHIKLSADHAKLQNQHAALANTVRRSVTDLFLCSTGCPLAAHLEEKLCDTPQ